FDDSICINSFYIVLCFLLSNFVFFFFFQAEDGIRDRNVTGVQTCALPIFSEDTPIEELVQHDLAFHHTITAAGGNAYLTSLLDALSSSTARARVWRGITQDRAVARTLAEHERILQALRARDKEMVRAALTVHIGGVDSWL